MNDMRMWPLAILGLALFWIAYQMSKGWRAEKRESLARVEPYAPRRSAVVYIDRRQINVFLTFNASSAERIEPAGGRILSWRALRITSLAAPIGPSLRKALFYSV